MLDQVFSALAMFFEGDALLYLLVGVIVGCIFGALPGLGGIQAIAILLPLTYAMGPENAIMMIMGILGATAPAGAVTAILLNTPGTPENASHTFDGFKMTQQNRAGVALGANASASILGAVVGVLVLMIILPIGKYVVLAFSYPEYFMLALVGLSAIATLSQGAMWKGLIAALLGLIIAAVGYDPVTAEIRFAFGMVELYEGVDLVAALIGIFAIAQAIKMFAEGGTIADNPTKVKVSTLHGIGEGIMSVFKHFGLFFRSSILGTIIGIIPGVGGATANFVAYGQAVQTAKDPEKFGTGDVRGIIAPSAADNSKDGGALVPTLIFGIPGSVVMAVVITALTIHDLQPGPRLLLDNPHMVWLLMFALVASNVLAGLFCLFMGGMVSPLVRVRSTFIAPVIIAVALLGAYTANGVYFDVIVAVVFGILGYVMERFGFSRIPLIIAMTLGPLMDVNFNLTLTRFGFGGFFERPLSLILFILMIVLVMLPYIQKRLKAKRDGKELTP